MYTGHVLRFLSMLLNRLFFLPNGTFYYAVIPLESTHKHTKVLLYSIYHALNFLSHTIPHFTKNGTPTPQGP